jgi:hypothetical protein
MIGSTFWKKYIIGSKFCGKTWLGAHSGKKHNWQHMLGIKSLLAGHSAEKKHD